jgi:serine/threonine-protein kinase RsbW
MDGSGQPAGAMEARYVRAGMADGHVVAQIRNEFAAWLRTYLSLSAERLSDIVLAVNEALSNSAEYAYVEISDAGTISLDARHDGAAATLTVQVADTGAWYDGVPPPRHNTRGRGIPLMHALSDEVTIERLPRGTRVQMRFNGCAGVSVPGAMSEA